MQDANALRDAIEIDMCRMDRKSLHRHVKSLRAIRDTPADQRLIANAYAEVGGELEDAEDAVSSLDI